jgi:hypothetical protein
MVGRGVPGLNHRDRLKPGGFFRHGHMPLLATHAQPERNDVCPGVTFYSESCDVSRKNFPHDWRLTYQVNLTHPDDPPPLYPPQEWQYPQPPMPGPDKRKPVGGRGRGLEQKIVDPVVRFALLVKCSFPVVNEAWVSGAETSTTRKH